MDGRVDLPTMGLRGRAEYLYTARSLSVAWLAWVVHDKPAARIRCSFAERSNRNYGQGTGRAHTKVELDPVHACASVIENR